MLSFLLFPPTALCFPVSSPHAHTHLNFPLFPSSAALVLYQLQLTTSQVGLQDILDYAGAASSLRASSLLPHSSPRPMEALSQAAQRDTWPNRRNTSSCRLPDVRHGGNSGQRWRSSPGTTALPEPLRSVVRFHIYLTYYIKHVCVKGESYGFTL